MQIYLKQMARVIQPNLFRAIAPVVYEKIA